MEARMRNIATIVPEAMHALLALGACAEKGGVPKRTLVPTGASNCDTRALILSSPWISAKGSGIMSAARALTTAPAAASAIPASITPSRAAASFTKRRG